MSYVLLSNSLLLPLMLTVYLRFILLLNLYKIINEHIIIIKILSNFVNQIKLKAWEIWLAILSKAMPARVC